MLLILKSKRSVRTPALKCIDFATTACPAAADRLVDQGGLKTLFAIFLGKLKVGGDTREGWGMLLFACAGMSGIVNCHPQLQLLGCK